MLSKIIGNDVSFKPLFFRFSYPSPPSSSLPTWAPVPPTGNTNIVELKLQPEIVRELDKDKELFWQRLVWDHREGGEEIRATSLCK